MIYSATPYDDQGYYINGKRVNVYSSNDTTKLNRLAPLRKKEQIMAEFHSTSTMRENFDYKYKK